jgi:hypothetical protein
MVKIVDREFTELTDQMIIAHEVQGKPLSTLAMMLNRSLNSVLERREYLVRNGYYYQYAQEIHNYQKDAVANFAGRNRGSMFRTNSNRESSVNDYGNYK